MVWPIIRRCWSSCFILRMPHRTVNESDSVGNSAFSTVNVLTLMCRHPSKYLRARKTFLRSWPHEQTNRKHTDLGVHRTAVHPNRGAESCQKARGQSIAGSTRPRQTVDRNVGHSPTVIHARSSPDLPEPKPPPHRAYQRWRDESPDHDLEHLW